MNTSDKCLFCDNLLDDSDEHIIPRSINGRLHSKKIICSECNVKRFGSDIDPVLADTFKQIIHLLNLKNARAVYVEDPEGKKYLKGTGNQFKSIKPQVRIKQIDGLTHINISGDEKHVLRLLEKRAKEFIPKGSKPIKLDVIRNVNGSPPMGMELNFPITPKMVLVLNKMAIEYYVHQGGDRAEVSDIIACVAAKTFSLNNVTFCNWNQEVRKFEDEEISHLLLVVLSKNYKGVRISHQHRQDVLTGRPIDGNVALSIDAVNLIPNGGKVDKNDFSILLDSLFERHQTRNFSEVFHQGIKQILEDVKNEVKAGTLTNENLTKVYIERSAEFISYLNVYEFPFAVSDVGAEQQKMINYIHSCMGEDEFEEFCKLNSKLLGMGIAFTSEEHSPEKCVLQSFIKSPTAKLNGQQIVKVYCVLKHADSEELKYIPFRNLFEGLRRIQREGIKYITDD